MDKIITPTTMLIWIIQVQAFSEQKRRERWGGEGEEEEEMKKRLIKQGRCDSCEKNDVLT